MRMLARLLFVAVCVLAVVGFVFGRGVEQTSTVSRLDELGFRSTGLPIVDTPVTMEAMIIRPPHYPVGADEMTLLNDLQDRTNVRIEWELVPTAQLLERTNLMFASRTYPDVFFNAMLTDAQISDAALGGDVYALNEYIERYAPNWARALEEAPLMRRAITMGDGNIYGLPYYREIVNDYLIRDIRTINTTWLAKVGKPIPTTTDEFVDVLRAFRRGIDDGTLPRNAIPFQFRFHQWGNGGEFDVYGSFGVWMKDNTYLSVNNGTVEFGAIDPKLIDAVEYLHLLYSERLIVEEMFTDQFADHAAKIGSDPPILGGYGMYFLHEARDVDFDPLPPLYGPGGTRPIYRSQPIGLKKHHFVVMTRFAYPEVAVRFIDFFADDLTAIQMSYGRIGHELIDNRDGTFTAAAPEQVYWAHSPHDNIATYISREVSDRIIWLSDQGRRDQIAREVYGDYVWPQERHFPRVTYTFEELAELSVLETEIRDYVRSSIARWIVNGGVRREWDGFVRQLDRLGLDKLMAIYQAAADRFYE